MASITRFYALILSTVLLLSGVPGFFPNFTSFEPIVMFFALTLVHAVVHAAAGLLGLLITALASDDSVRIYTFGISLLYGILAGVGLLGVNFGPVLIFNPADNWLHGGIFVLSLGVVLAGVAEERVHQRTRRISEGLPMSHWAVPSTPSSLSTASTAPTPAAPFAPPTPSRRTNAPSSPLTQGVSTGYLGSKGDNGQNGQAPWINRPSGEPAGQNAWGAPAQAPWSPSQAPSSQSRDPWTREQRRQPAPGSMPPAQPAQSPSSGPQPGNPWSPYPPQQDQWSQNPPLQSPWPPDSQPSQHPNPWSRDSQAQDSQSGNSQPLSGQWPLDEWPSLRDSRPR